MLKQVYQWLFRVIGVRRLYRDVVIEDRLQNIRHHIRQDLQSLLERVNHGNEFFRGKFSEFLAKTANADDGAFFEAYARLPSFSKQDYAEAGQSVMCDAWAAVDPQQAELQMEGNPIQSVWRLRQGNYLMPMATGGSTSMPLVVRMTKQHMFSMLFTFFKCWYRMGWRPGERILVFYPRNTYNIDDMVKFNRFSRFTGFRYHLFDHIDEATVRDLVDDLNRYRPKLLLVFPSPMNMIAHTIRQLQLPLQHQPPLINVSGETFFDCQRRNIESVFDRSRIEDSYGSVELGEIAHETAGGLEVFANVAYVETEANDAGQPEMVITRLHCSDFPFIRYKMKDIAEVEFQTDGDGNQRYVITRIEGKDSNYILSDKAQRFYPSFFNQLVNRLNQSFDDSIIEIKVYERAQREMEVQLIIADASLKRQIAQATQCALREQLSNKMQYNVRFVDFIDHDYRRKYRVIERIGDIEFAGGMVGDDRKRTAIREIEQDAVAHEVADRAADHETPPTGLREAIVARDHDSV